VACADKSYSFARFDVTPSALYGWGIRVDGTQIEQYVVPRHPDATPPAITTAQVLPGGTEVVLQFSEALAMDAQENSNLALEHFTTSTGTLTSVSVSATFAEVRLTVSPAALPNRWLWIGVTGLVDLYGNPMSTQALELLVPTLPTDDAEGDTDGGDTDNELRSDALWADGDVSPPLAATKLSNSGCSCNTTTSVQHRALGAAAILWFESLRRRRRRYSDNDCA